jgi:hypothetical protein
MISDRDSKFTAHFWQSLWQLCGTTLRMSAARQQNTDGQAERAIATVEDILRMGINHKQDNWTALMSAAEFAINNTITRAHGMTPFFCETRRDPLMPIDLSRALKLQEQPAGTGAEMAKDFLEKLRAVHQLARDRIEVYVKNMCDSVNKRRAHSPCLTNKKVWLLLDGIELDQFRTRPCKKLNPIFFGPYEVVQQVSPVSYKLKLPHTTRVHDVFHVSRLKLYNPNEFPGRRPKPLPAIIEDQYEVHNILDKRTRYGKPQYLVHWKGYRECDATWEPTSHLKNCSDVLKDFNTRLSAQHD